MKPFVLLLLLTGLCACRSLPSEKAVFPGMPARFALLESDRPRVTNLKSSRDEIITHMRSENALNAAEAKDFLQRKASYVRSLYASYLDPYFGQPDQNRGCAENLDLSGKVFESDRLSWTSFQLPATKELVYGVCDRKLHAYKSELLYLHCRKTGYVIELKSYWPVGADRGTTWNLEEVCANATP